MDDVDLFQCALGLTDPWEVVGSSFDPGVKRLDLRVDFVRGAKFPCPECGHGGCPVHDSEPQTWRHLDFFQHRAYLHARVPRVRCPEHGVRRVAVPWARGGRSDFTLLFEALIMAMVKEMPVAAVAKLVGEYDKKMWRVVHHYVDQAVAGRISRGRGRWGSMRRASGVGIATCRCSAISRLLSVGRRSSLTAAGRETVGEFAMFLGDRGGDRAKISEVCQDMSGAYLAGVHEHLHAARVTFDRFHVKQKLSEAVDEIRCTQAKEQKELLATLGICGSSPPRT